MRVAILLLFALCSLCSGAQYPVPIPAGGRSAVHGWLILLCEQDPSSVSDPAAPITAWFSHHVPEFFTTSPHDFQIIVKGTLTPMSVAENITERIDLPYPPAANLLSHEYTFTPPPNFSLNDLLSGAITQLKGVVYNGSFDTSYEREAVALATLEISQLTTAVYMSESASVKPYSMLRYLSYPRRPQPASPQGMQHFYLAHEIHAVPDFDQIVHIEMDLDSCTCTACPDDDSVVHGWIYQAAAEWEFSALPNDLAHRLSVSGAPVVAQLLSAPLPAVLQCKMRVLEQNHCMVGPGFDVNC